MGRVLTRRCFVVLVLLCYVEEICSFIPKIFSDRKTKGLLSSTIPDFSISLKVPPSAWRWPSAWPFPDDFLEPVKYDGSANELDSGLYWEKVNLAMKELLTLNENVLIVVNEENQKLLMDVTNAQFECVCANKSFSYKTESFDKVVFVCGIELLENPRFFFRDVWRVLKSGGKCYSFFRDLPVVPKESEPIKMWTTMNDEQKIWITGSYMHYSVVGGWTNVSAFDMSDKTEKGSMNFKRDDVNTTYYFVEGQKIEFPAISSSGNNTRDYIAMRLLCAENLDLDDRMFSATRLASDYNKAKSEASKDLVLERVDKIGEIYQILKDVKEIVVPSPVKSLLAVMISDKWTNSQTQIAALRMAFSLQKPDEEFWVPIGSCLDSLAPKDKIYFLADIVSAFGDDNLRLPLQQAPGLLTDILKKLKSRFPEIELAKLQYFGTDLLIADFIRNGSSANRVLKFVQEYPDEKLRKMIIES